MRHLGKYLCKRFQNFMIFSLMRISSEHGYVSASLMLTLNDERKKRVQNVLFYVENEEDEESFVYGELQNNEIVLNSGYDTRY